MRFENANLLWLLPVLPLAMVLFFWWRERSRRKALTQFIEARLLSALTVGISSARREIRFTLLILASACLVVALARPQHGFDLQQVEQLGLDIVVAVDTSKSMLADDVAPNRLQHAKLGALEMARVAANDRVGLVAFAGDAFLECPVTIDSAAYAQSAQALDVNTISEGGTALANAIQTSLTAFKESSSHKILVLLTDGDENDDEAAALAAAKEAAKAGLKIYTVGFGTVDGTLLRTTDANGNSDYIRDPDGNVVKSHLNEKLLQQIAEATGGFYLPWRGVNTIDTLYERGLAQLPKSQGSETMLKQYHEQYHWPLTFAILLLLAEIFLPERKKSKAQNPKSKVAASAAVIAILFLPAIANASPASALRDYNSGNFTNALEQFQQLAQAKTNDLRMIFNAGDAAYRATNFDLAQSLFGQVTISPDLKMQQKAFYNLGNAQFQSAKNAADLDGLQNGLETAQKSYERAVNLNTNDVDAVYNLNFTKDAVERIKEFRAMILRTKGEADDAVRRAEFHKALEIIEPLQKTLAAKQFEDYTKKLKDIDEIATPNQK